MADIAAVDDGPTCEVVLVWRWQFRRYSADGWTINQSFGLDLYGLLLELPLSFIAGWAVRELPRDGAE